tara:strand:+ start:459 stop:671 length:213 start_codon:yes stop_codon:yes gene_type:complete
MELYTLEYYRHKSKVQQLQIDWLDELCNYEREGWNEFNDDEDRDERREDIDNLYKLFTEEQKKFKELYNL